MDKFCIFCGEKPEAKNREHVIPQWLIRMTGDPNRKVYLGRKWADLSLEKREYAFNSFTFPACKQCNADFAKLESDIKPILEAILNRNPIASRQWDLFFDWLDKVRVGIWLGMLYLNKNHRGLIPMFHIKNRIGSKDRFVIIYEMIDDGDIGVGWAATDTPLFQYTQSCFTLTVNNFLFFNSSFDFLFSKNLGFPYPKKWAYRKEGGMWIEMNEGKENFHFPLVAKKFKTGGTQFFQPIIPYNHIRSNDGDLSEFMDLYNTSYVRSHCIDFETGKGLIYRRDRNRLVIYPDTPSKEWIPKQRFARGELHHQTGILALEFLEELYLKTPSLEYLSHDEQQQRIAEIEGSVQLHKTIMEHYLRQKDIYY